MSSHERSCKISATQDATSFNSSFFNLEPSHVVVCLDDKPSRETRQTARCYFGGQSSEAVLIRIGRWFHIDNPRINVNVKLLRIDDDEGKIGLRMKVCGSGKVTLTKLQF